MTYCPVRLFWSLILLQSRGGARVLLLAAVLTLCTILPLVRFVFRFRFRCTQLDGIIKPIMTLCMK